IQMSLQEQVDEALEELDDDRFMRFCQMKAADWSQRTIMRELGFTQALYDAGMARLRQLRDTMPEERDEPPPKRMKADLVESPQPDPDMLRRKLAIRERGELVERMKAAKVTQTKLAKHLQITPQEMSNVLSGLHPTPMRANVFFQLVNALLEAQAPAQGA